MSRSQKTPTRIWGLGFIELKLTPLIELRDVIWVFGLEILWTNLENIAGTFELTETMEASKNPGYIPDPNPIRVRRFSCLEFRSSGSRELRRRNKFELQKYNTYNPEFCKFTNSYLNFNREQINTLFIENIRTILLNYVS